ncbi:hypothetical protein [Alloacidobacterium sp.]|uniref:hypothetical protein n=1 Tax=Alloacidobacterium sp. TaxID=2951999 RepID=UPI002D48155F|nr:hypothetical protein [Alloacidobacterium sp.]HYK37476.1 hypothetical protein [Alloacidobacterium sp.]
MKREKAEKETRIKAGLAQDGDEEKPETLSGNPATLNLPKIYACADNMGAPHLAEMWDCPHRRRLNVFNVTTN